MKRLLAVGIVLMLILSVALCGCGKEEAPPAQAVEPDYGFSLTEEQLQNYQSAVSYLLKREGEDYYLVQYSQMGASLVDGRVCTDFDGMAVRVFDENGDGYYPELKLHRGEDGMINAIGRMIFTDHGADGDGGNAYSGYCCMYQIDPEHKSVELKAMLPTEENAEEKLLQGEGQLIDFATADEIGVLWDCSYTPTYGDDENLLLLQEWESTACFYFYTLFTDSDIQVEYAPLEGGDYYLLYEITDQQGNTYCSDLIHYETPQEAYVKNPPDCSVKWEAGEREVLLFEEDGITARLCVEKNSWNESYYALKVKNETETEVSAKAFNAVLNGMVSTKWTASVTVRPGRHVAGDSGIAFGLGYSSPEARELKTMEFTVEVQDKQTYEVLMRKVVLVDMVDAWPLKTDESAYFQLQEPYRGALAEEQVLLENEAMKLSLVGAGGMEPESGMMYLVLRLENRSHKAASVRTDQIFINGVADSVYTTITAEPGCISYGHITIFESDIQNYVASGIESIGLLMIVEGQEDWSSPSKTNCWVELTLSQRGEAEPFDQGQLLWEEGGFQMGVRKYFLSKAKWEITLTNTSERMVCFRVVDAETGKEDYVETVAIPGGYGLYELRNTAGETKTVRFRIYDYETEELLLESPDVVLTVE